MYAASAKASSYAGVNSSFLLNEVSPSASAAKSAAPIRSRAPASATAESRTVSVSGEAIE